MGLIDRISALFTKRSRAQVENTLQVENPAAVGNSTQALALFGAEAERARLVRFCREMYAGDPRVKGILKAVARDVVRGGFQVNCKGNARAEAVANALVKRLGLASKLDDWVRLTLRDGDTFLEVGVSAGGEIVDVSRKPTLQMHRQSDAADRFADPLKAYWWAGEAWVGQQPPGDALWFAEWQIVHARWDHDEGSRYGEPLFASAVKAFKRMSEGETDIAVRRKTRSGMRYLHSLEDAGEAEIEAYKERNKNALESPFAAVIDFFANQRVTISAIQGDAHLAEIDDVLHHIRTFWVASPLPMSLLGYGQDLNRDVLEEQQEQYERALEQIAEWVEEELVRPLLERQWLLAGILPDGLDYELVWKNKRPVTAGDLRDAADAALRLKSLGLPGDVVVSVLGRFLPGIDLSAVDLDGGVERQLSAGAGLYPGEEEDGEQSEEDGTDGRGNGGAGKNKPGGDGKTAGNARAGRGGKDGR